MTANVATLLVGCPDRKGIVASLAQLLYGHGANILDSDQHSDPVEGQFFQRIRFDLSSLLTDRHTLESGIREVAQRFSMDWRLEYGHRTKRVAVLGVIGCSHRDTVEDLVRKGRDVEKRVLAAAVRWHLEDRILVYANKTVVFE